MSVFADSQRSGHHLPDTFPDGFPLNYPASFLAECQAVCLNRSISFPQKLTFVRFSGFHDFEAAEQFPVFFVQCFVPGTFHKTANHGKRQCLPEPARTQQWARRVASICQV